MIADPLSSAVMADIEGSVRVYLNADFGLAGIKSIQVFLHNKFRRNIVVVLSKETVVPIIYIHCYCGRQFSSLGC